MVILEKHSNHQFIHSYKYLFTVHDTEVPTEYVVPFGIWNWRIFIVLVLIWVFCMEPLESPGILPPSQLFPADFSEVSTALGGHQSEVQIPHDIARIPFLLPEYPINLASLNQSLVKLFFCVSHCGYFRDAHNDVNTVLIYHWPNLMLLKSWNYSNNHYYDIVCSYYKMKLVRDHGHIWSRNQEIK